VKRDANDASDATKQPLAPAESARRTITLDAR
jgi:hypothetical protein